MEPMLLPTITMAQYQEILDLVSQAKMCCSAKDANEHISNIKLCANYLPERAAFKVCEIADCLRQYCKRGSDRETANAHLNNALGVLSSMVETEAEK